MRGWRRGGSRSYVGEKQAAEMRATSKGAASEGREERVARGQCQRPERFGHCSEVRRKPFVLHRVSHVGFISRYAAPAFVVKDPTVGQELFHKEEFQMIVCDNKIELADQQTKKILYSWKRQAVAKLTTSAQSYDPHDMEILSLTLRPSGARGVASQGGQARIHGEVVFEVDSGREFVQAWDLGTSDCLV
jgi:hypothetical protein